MGRLGRRTESTLIGGEGLVPSHDRPVVPSVERTKFLVALLVELVEPLDHPPDPRLVEDHHRLAAARTARATTLAQRFVVRRNVARVRSDPDYVKSQDFVDGSVSGHRGRSGS